MKRLLKWLALALAGLVLLSVGLTAWNMSAGVNAASEVTLTEKTPEEIEQEYRSYLAPADDEVDFLFANDYVWLQLVKLLKGQDAVAYGPLLGIEGPITPEDIARVLETNPGIEETYKQFIVDYVTDWLALYPESDFRVLYHNLQTLVIDTVTSEELMWKTQSTDSAAAYLRQENRIILLEDQDFSRDTDNYIILTHELTHAARSASFEREDGVKVRIGYFELHKMGTYAEEGIITNLAYALQGLTDRAVFYPFQSACYRVIADCVGYDGADFMNHSVNYLITKMDEFMGDDQGYYIVALIDAISAQRYTPYQGVDYTDYQDLCDYLTRMYMKKYLSPDSTAAQAEQVYEEFIRIITFRFDEMTRPYPITAENFRPEFERILEERNG